MQNLRTIIVRSFVFLIWICFCCSIANGQGKFSDVAEDLNIEHTFGFGSHGGGVSFYDFNKDGWDDLVLATCAGEQVHFYVNNSGSFEKIPSPIDNTFETKQILWVDYDNDGDADLFITSIEENLLYKNNGQYGFEEVTTQVGLPVSDEDTYGAAWGDYNRDGWLDLYVTDKENNGDIKERSNHLYQNVEGLFFFEMTLSTNTADSAKAPFAVAFLDINNDNWQDLYIAQDKHKGNTLLKNEGYNYFADIGSVSNSDLIMDGMCVAVGDYNNDQFPDIYISNTSEGNALFRNNTDETFTELGAEAGVALYELAWGSSFFDYDNDGLLDLYVCNMLGKNSMYKNLDKVNFDSLYNIGFDKDTVTSFSDAIGDFNKDGYPDIAVSNFGYFNSTLWQNPGDYNNNWLKVSLDGVYSNKDAIGSRIVTYVGDEIYSRYMHCGIGYLAQNSQHEIIGIGQASTIDSLKVFWLSGLVDTYYDIPINSEVLITEGETTTPIPKLNVSGHMEICQGEYVNLNGGYFSSNFGYHWSTCESGVTIYVSEEGMYFLDLEDMNGNYFRSDTLTVSVIESPSISNAIVTGVSCHNSMDGSIEIEISGGQPPYAVSWHINDNSLKIENIGAGGYYIEVSDQNDCIDHKFFELLNPEPLSITTVVESATNGDENGSVLLTASGGTGPYKYYLGDPLMEVEAQINDLATGNHPIAVTDAHECERKMGVYIPSSITTDLNEKEITYTYYPNPSSDYIFIETGTNKEVKIVLKDLFGIDCLQTEIINSGIIDIRNQESGVYLLQIGNDPLKKLIIND